MPRVFICVHTCVCVCIQVLYSEKESERPPSVLLAEGEKNGSLLVGALRKYTIYALQVLAYTRMGDGPPSSPMLLRTKEDGRKHYQLSASVLVLCFPLGPPRVFKKCDSVNHNLQVLKLFKLTQIKILSATVI